MYVTNHKMEAINEEDFSSNSLNNLDAQLMHSSCTAKDSWYKKMTKKLDSIDEQKIEKKLTDSHEGLVEGLEDAKADINAPKEKQSRFAKLFNYIADNDIAETCANDYTKVNPEDVEKVGAYTDAR